MPWRPHRSLSLFRQVDLLFSPHGRVRRIKIYRDDAGAAKGDALVTFVKTASVSTAVQKLDQFEVAPGVVISASPADFSHKQKEDDDDEEEEYDEEEEDGGGGGYGAENGAVETEDAPPAFVPLPEDCKAPNLPTCVLRNVYTQEQVGHPMGTSSASFSLPACQSV